jgi:hypothetical protein
MSDFLILQPEGLEALRAENSLPLILVSSMCQDITFPTVSNHPNNFVTGLPVTIRDGR